MKGEFALLIESLSTTLKLKENKLNLARPHFDGVSSDCYMALTGMDLANLSDLNNESFGPFYGPCPKSLGQIMANPKLRCPAGSSSDIMWHCGFDKQNNGKLCYRILQYNHDDNDDDQII